MRLIPKLPNAKDTAVRKQADFYKSLIHYEAKIGGELFGPIPEGHRREFFCLDRHTWVWHEEWLQDGKNHALTTRYDIRPSGILKSQGGRHYQSLSLQESRNLYAAMKLYVERMRVELPKLAHA